MKTMGVTGSLLGLFALLAGFGTAQAQEPKTPERPKVAAPKPKDDKEPPEKAVSRLVEQLRLHPARPSTAEKRYALYLIDLATGELTLVADQPDPGLTYCGSATWSHDGRRIAFDATPWTEWSLSRLKTIEIADGRLAVSDLGFGNCPTFSPAGDRIAFLNNSNVGGAESGVWLMQADGSQRRMLGEYGRPRWSPDSRQFMIVSFSKPCEVTLMDVRPEKSGVLRVPGQNLFPVPSWTGEGTIVTVLGPDVGDTIALVDVTNPAEGKVKEILWKRANDTDLLPTFPLYSAITRRCVFVGGGPKGMALYSFQVGKSEPPKRLEPEGFDKEIVDLAMSPDGRYVLFSSNRPAGQQPPQAATARSDAAQGKGAAPVAKKERLGKIYVISSDGTLIAIDPQTGEKEEVLSIRTDRPRISPDGLSVAYQVGSGLWVRGLGKDAEPKQVLDLGKESAGSPPAWSGGKQVVISPGHTSEGPNSHWVFTTVRVNVDGSGHEELAIPPEDGVQDCSSDGRWLLIASSRNAKMGWQLYVMRPDGKEERRITEKGNPFYARFSPDGRRVLYTDQGLREQSGIWVVDVDGTNRRRIFPLDSKTQGSACWSLDGKRVAIALGDRGAQGAAEAAQPFRVVVMDLDGGHRSEFFISKGRASDMPDWR